MEPYRWQDWLCRLKGIAKKGSVCVSAARFEAVGGTRLIPLDSPFWSRADAIPGSLDTSLFCCGLCSSLFLRKARAGSPFHCVGRPFADCPWRRF